MYASDCEPVSGSTILDSAFHHQLLGGLASHNTSIRLRFYGPVFQNDTDPAIKIEHHFANSWQDVTENAVIEFGSATGGNPREIVIYGPDGSTSQIPFLWGDYRITGVVGELKCADALANPAPDADTSFEYLFTLGRDCNRNNRLDSEDLLEAVGEEPNKVYVYDFNNNGIIDSCDRPTGGWCLADIDLNGYVNGNDYDWFAVFFEESHFLADVNEDGYVNGNDYDLFAEHFDAGC